MTARYSPTTPRFLRASLVFVLLGFSLFAHYRLVPYADDDAYIHMRVARNLWEAAAPYFNVGEPVMASTSPLWIVATAPAAAAGANQPLVIAVSNSCLLVGAAYVWGLLYIHLIHSRRVRDLVCAAGIALFTMMSASVGLMETPLAMLLVGSGVLSVVRSKRWGLPLLCASVFVRPECVIFFLSAFAWKVMRRSSWTVSEVGLSAGVVALLAGFQLHFYDSLYPHTARAKEVVYQITGSEYVRLLSNGSYGDWIAKSILPYVIVAVIVLCVVATFRLKRFTPTTLVQSVRENPLLVVLLPALVILAAYSVKRVLVFPWYAPLFLVPMHLTLLWGATHAALWGRLLAVTLLLPFIAMSVELAWGSKYFGALPFFEAGARARKLKHIGEWLALEHPHSKVLAPEIGALGFSFPGKIDDAVGLASPKALQFHPLKVPEQRPTGFHGGVPAALVERDRPDVIVALDVFMTDFLKSKVSESYEVRQVPPLLEEDRARVGDGKVFGGDHLLIAVRK